MGGSTDAGAAHLISDLPDNEGTPRLEAIVLTQADLDDAAETGDGFGTTVMITGTNQEDRHRFVVGAPGEAVGRAVDARSVGVFEMGPDPIGLAELRQGRRGPLGAIRLPGTPESGDRFGASLAGGAVDLPEWSGTEVGLALVIGAPGDRVSGRDAAGSVRRHPWRQLTRFAQMSLTNTGCRLISRWANLQDHRRRRSLG